MARTVYRQTLIDNAVQRKAIIESLEFRGGPAFKVRDGVGAAHIFYEIFLLDQYPKSLLCDAKVIVDVGANIGLFSYYARRHAPNARIFAYEADPDTFAVLDVNLKDQSIEKFHRAVASKSGAIDFFSSPVSGWSSLYREGCRERFIADVIGNGGKAVRMF